MSLISEQATERLEFRIDAEQKRLIQRAAAIRGTTVTSFAVATLCDEAREIVESQETLILSSRDRDAFLAALDSPPAPNAKLIRAMKR